ncbi:MAG: decaprenylphospho-beta-D-erythro-pentofuranosid-2-ulose 2-reductase [Halioglobus sp.]|jgi:decaprenylphospho-beta-D-erythro-pentofuranosid-2-ulose 2-reductase
MGEAKKILVFGASSAIAHALLKLYATQGSTFFLAGRSEDKVAAVADDLIARGGKLGGSYCYDFSDSTKHENCLAQARESLGEIDVAIVAHGTLPDQLECEASVAAVSACVEDNFSSAIAIMQTCAQQLATQGRGTLAVMSSVAGDRGRKSNYSYGACKAGIDAFIQGLQGRFAGSKIKVVNIKPGMIESPMTQEMEHGALWSTPEKIAPGIYRAIEKGSAVVYLPGYWRLIMWVIRMLPASIMARLPI